MESTFIYDRPVTGKLHIGRKSDCERMVSVLRSGESVCIYEPPKTGKTSLIRQSLLMMKNQRDQFIAIESSFLSVRTVTDLALDFGSQLIGAISNTPQETAEAVFRHFAGSNFEYDPKSYAKTRRVLSLRSEATDQDLKAVFSLPFKIASEFNQKLYIILDEFQNILNTEEPDRVFGILDSIIRSASAKQRQKCSFIFCGSRVNAMKYIFEEQKWFKQIAVHIEISPVAPKEIAAAVNRCFLTTGKVIEEDQILELCSTLQCNIWYVNHFCAICDGISKGYVVTPIINESLSILLSIHEPRFRAIMDDLTTFQTSLLRAILEGQTKFSSADVIEKYGLNSSANVRRLKDALCKKEIITFHPDDSATILDPLFEYWAAHQYFRIAR